MLTTHNNSWSVLLPGVLLLGLATTIFAQTGWLTQLSPASRSLSIAPGTVVVPAHEHAYRAAGDYLQEGVVVDAPLLAEHRGDLEIMTHQVRAVDYERCVVDGACRAAEPRRRGTGDVPVTGVSYRDAEDYASWLSAQTGDNWRLPTVAEWTFAAGSKAVDTALGVETDAANPAERWLAFYEKQARLGDGALATPQPVGSFGVNEFGVGDLAGTVWEWTSTCGNRSTLNGLGDVVTRVEACGVRYLEGRHRTALSVFVRDAVGGGCSMGIPPDNLGFRLVRERPWLPIKLF